MKPLLSQLQNQAHLDDLLGSVKGQQGKFDRPTSGQPLTSGKSNSGPSFNDLLLTTIAKDRQPKPQANQSQANKLPDPTPRVERPSPKPSLQVSDTKTAERPSRLADQTPDSGRTPKIPSDQSSTVSKGAKSLNSQESATSEAKAALAPLRKQFSGKTSSEALLNSNAVVSFISGRLDKIAPDALASVITDSPLIKQVMSSGDISTFMQTSMTIADLSQMFELDQGILTKAVMNGLDAADLVTVKDFVNALGLDAGRISAELTQLQQRLPAEGLKSYVERAQALAGAQANTSMMAQSGAKASIDSVMEASDLKNADFTKLESSAHMDELRSKSLRQDTSGSTIDVPMGGELAGQANVATMLPSKQNAALRVDEPTDTSTIRNTQRPTLNAKVTRPDELAENLSALAIRSGQALIQPISTEPLNVIDVDTGNSLQPLRASLTPASQAAVTIPGKTPDTQNLEPSQFGEHFGSESINLEFTETMVSSDPFKDMGLILDPNQSTRIEFGGNGTNQRTLEELLIDRNFEPSFGPGNDRQTLNEMTNNALPELMSPMADALQPQQFNQNQVSLENLLASSASPSSGGGSFSDGMFNDQESSSGGESSLTEQTLDMGRNLSQQPALKDTTKGEFVNRLAGDSANIGSKNSFASKILAHAQMMLKDGGGAMRINVEAPGMGRVDVAINLINNQLDVRIITASEQARDMISREVTGLRDGLGQQGISLRGLEIGKAGESSSRQFAGQGQQQFGQGARDQRASYDDMRQYVQSFKNAYTPSRSVATDRLAPAMQRAGSIGAMPNAAGRLEIRV